MDDFSHAMSIALSLAIGLDAQLVAIVWLSLQVSLTASLAALVVGLPIGAALAMSRFPGRGAAIVVGNALLGLPPVVVGLALYLMMSRQGPLGNLGLLFTPPAMVIAQATLGTPIVAALAHRAFEPLWRDYGDALAMDGASWSRAVVELVMIGRGAVVTIFLAAFGRAIAEVGAILIVGGNIQGFTRTMTTAIALETSKGDLPLALALGLVLLTLSLAVASSAFLLERVLPGLRN